MRHRAAGTSKVLGGAAENGPVTLRLGKGRIRLWTAVVVTMLCVGAVISVVTVASVGNRAPTHEKKRAEAFFVRKRRRRRIHCAMRERRKEQSAGTPPSSQRR